MVVEFADHVAIVEVPAGEARTLAVIAKAKELVPGKPVTQAIVAHHHVDHTGGLRTAVAEGLTIVYQPGTTGYLIASSQAASDTLRRARSRSRSSPSTMHR
jgi:glyoxylase-like metal-dependent hydrolase (beta-lactamase superfamily II)